MNRQNNRRGDKRHPHLSISGSCFISKMHPTGSVLFRFERKKASFKNRFLQFFEKGVAPDLLEISVSSFWDSRRLVSTSVHRKRTFQKLLSRVRFQYVDLLFSLRDSGGSRLNDADAESPGRRTPGTRGPLKTKENESKENNQQRMNRQNNRRGG